MACCAFAVFLIGQLYLVFGGPAERLGLRSAARARAVAADWRPGVEPVNNGVQSVPGGRWRPFSGRGPRWSFAVILAISMGALGIAIAHSLHSESNWRADLLAASSWCRSSLILGAN